MNKSDFNLRISVFNTGVTMSSPALILPLQPVTLDELFFREIVKHITDNSIDPNILRYNQVNGRYSFIGKILTKPPKKKGIYEYGNVLGIIYKCNIEERNSMGKKIIYKQDFVVYDEKKDEYRFVLELNKWMNHFPLLVNHRNIIWSWDDFNRELANGKHYYNKSLKKFNHYFYSKKELEQSTGSNFGH